MKRLITLSVALLGVCSVVVVSPSSGSAAPSDKKDKSDAKAVVKPAKAAPRDRIYYVMTRECATGSNIPTVYRVYHGVATSTSTNTGSTYTDISAAGSENIGTSLARLDPSITLGNFHATR